MSLDKLNKLATSLAKEIDDNESFLTSFVANKLTKAAETYPNDSTIISVASIVNKLADKNLLISRKQLKDLHNKFYVRNTKFYEVCESELGEATKLMAPKMASREAELELGSEQFGDQVLANALESVFDATIPLKMYAKDVGETAKKAVSSSLESWDLAASKIEIEEGNEKFIVVKASYDTPKGMTSFYVPVQIIANKIATPSVFVGNSGPQDLNNANVRGYLTSCAGNKLKLSGVSILQVITKSASEDRDVSDVELAMARLNSNRQEKQEYFSNQVLNQQVDAETREIQMPRYSEFSHLEDKFISPTGVASFNFGEDKVTIARNVITRNLNSFGFKNAQVTVTDSNDNTIFYAVALDAGRIGFTVPVKIHNNNVTQPEVILCKGAVNSFSAASIKQLYASNVTDYKAAATASPHYGLKGSELVDAVRDAVEEQNLAKAEDALNVLAESGDVKSYASGFKVYASALTGQTQANDITKHPHYNANDFYTTTASSLLISKSTGLPINKIYIDDNGNHRPLYRRGMSDTYQGGFFMNYKIFG